MGQECCLPVDGFLNYGGAFFLEDLPEVPLPPTLFLSVWRGKWDRRKSLLWKASSMPGTLRLNSVIMPSPCLPCAESSSRAGTVNFSACCTGLYKSEEWPFHWHLEPSLGWGGRQSKNASASLGQREGGARVMNTACSDSPWKPPWCLVGEWGWARDSPLE